MLPAWLDWHRATLLRKCAGLDATRLAQHAVPPSNLSLLGPSCQDGRFLPFQVMTNADTHGAIHGVAIDI